MKDLSWAMAAEGDEVKIPDDVVMEDDVEMSDSTLMEWGSSTNHEGGDGGGDEEEQVINVADPKDEGSVEPVLTMTTMSDGSDDKVSTASSTQSDDEYSFCSTACDDAQETSSIDGFEDLAKCFDMKTLRSCIEKGNSVLDQVDGKDVVLVVGKTGVGKSLFIQGIAGKKIVSVVHEMSRLGEKVSSQVFEAEDSLPGFEVGHEKVSKTRSINVFFRCEGKKKGILYLDSPGFEDTDGPEVDIATSVMLSQVSQRAKSLRFVVLINYASLLEDRGGAMRAVLKLAHTFVADFAKDKKCFMFLITHSNEVEMPDSSLKAARSFLAKDLLRIKMGTNDPDVEMVLKFMLTSITKKYPFVDVLHPLQSDYGAISGLIETKLSTVRNPALVVNCGLTPQSKMKLIGQLQRMLYTMRGLLHEEKGSNHNSEELKQIRDSFQYLKRFIGIEEVNAAFHECESLIGKHLCTQRLILEMELKKAVEKTGHVGIKKLKGAANVLAAFSDGSTNTGYIEKRIGDAVCETHHHVMEFSFENLDEALCELDTLKVWTDNFPKYVALYEEACHSISTKIEGIVSDVLGKEISPEVVCAEKVVNWAQKLVQLTCVLDTRKKLEFHKIDTTVCLEALTSSKAGLLALAGTWGASTLILDREEGELWSDLPSMLSLAAQRAKSLELACAVLEKAQACTDISQRMGCDLNELKSASFQAFQTLCRPFSCKLESFPQDAEKKLSCLSALASSFDELCTPLSNVQQPYHAVIENISSELQVMSVHLDYSARVCQTDGMHDGSKEAEQYLSFRSYLWLDTFSNQISVQDCCDSIQIVYQSRMQLIMDETAKQSQMLRVGAKNTVSILQACHRLLLEIKQFEHFESMVAGRCDSVQEKKKMALAGMRQYSQDLVEKTKHWCANWYGSLQAKELDDARVLTETLDRVLAEIEMIDSFSCFPRIKQAAAESKDCILHQFKTAQDFVDGEFIKPQAYEVKAYCLACIATINGLRRTDNFLPNINDYKEKARSLVSADARKIQSLLEESPDSNEIDECLEVFECARVLDAYTSNEATNQLRPLLSLREKRVDETGKMLEDMIEREDFKGIGKFLRPLQRSKDLIKKQQFEQHARTISNKMKSRASEVSEKLNLLMSREDVESVAHLLRIMKEASKEIGFFLNSSELMLSREIDRLEQKLLNRLQRTIDAMLAGCSSGDFYSMGKNHHFALNIIDHCKPSLDWRVKSDFRNANKEMEAAISDLSKHVDEFHSSLFRESALLERGLSSLKIAANSSDPELPQLKGLYDTTLDKLSQRTNALLGDLYEGVTESGSYDDGIQALEALGRAKARGLTEHMASLPFDPDEVLDEWKGKQARLEDPDFSGENAAEVLKGCKQRLDRLKNRWTLTRWVTGNSVTYKKHRQQLDMKGQKRLEQGLQLLYKRDWVALRKCLDILNQMENELSEHIPALERRRKELQDKIMATFIEICNESVHILEKANCSEASSFVAFEAIFPELHECVLHFTGVLSSPNSRKAFCLVNQLVHDHMKRGISELKDAISNHSFSQARALVGHNRTHGAFLADHYALLFEELKQRNTLQDGKWLVQIWKICCETFWCGRDLKNIKACAVLGVLPSANEEDIRKAYKHKAREVHPDKNSHNGDDDAGKEFRRVKDAHDLLLEARSKEETNSQIFDPLLLAIPGALKKEVRDHLREQRYDLVELLLERLPDFQMVCNLVCPPLDFDTVRNDVVKTVLDRVHEGKVDVETFWNDRKYKELNHSIDDLKQMEHHLKSFPDVFPESWNKGIVEKVEEEIESLGKKARFYVKDKRTAADHEDDFRRCFIQMGSVLVELQSFKDFTKSVMYDVLESCLNADWGFSYLFELGLSFHRGDDRIAQTLLSEFTHFKEVITMVWNEETVQKPVEDTVADIAGVQRGSGEAISIDKKALLESFHSFDKDYKLLLGEYLPAVTDKRKLANKTIALANSLKPLCCSSGWDARVKRTIPQILAGVFALFTVLKSGESFNRIQEGSADAQKIGQKLLMRPHNIQVLTLLHLLGCGTSDTSLESHLMQIRTGEGKSMILGAAVTILALLGFKVRCVCYSEYLSKRDYSLFEEVFKYLGLDGLVAYSKITALSEDTTARKGDIRALTKSLLRQNFLQRQPDSTAPMLGSQTEASRVKKLRHEGEEFRQETSASHSKGGSAEVTQEVLSPTTTDAQEVSVKSSTSFQSAEGLEEILLVDEVDVFFGPDFYGQTYNKVMELHEPEISAILTDIWTKNNSGSRKQRLTDVQATSPYQSLVQKMPMFQFLIDNEIRLMLDHVSRVDEEPYYLDADNDRIGYKVLDTISYQVTYGYRTVFAYLKEANEGNLNDEKATLKRVLCMPIQCGQFSYSNISPSRILGVSGTLQAMGEYEKDVLQGYGVDKFIIVPSVYGKSNFVFDRAGDGIFIEPNKSDYFQKICDEVISKIHQRRAVIVFFENIARLGEFKSSPFFTKLGRNKAVLSENMEPSAKEFVINKAATSGQITLSPAVFGRGTDFFCKDDRVQDGGGVHIIQTFLSQEKSEEVQIQGRTSRQGKKGSYQLVLWEDDLCKDFDLKRGEKDSVPRNQRYDWLCDARDKRHSQHWKKVDEDLKVAEHRDADTHQYFDSLLAGSRHDATRLFKELYLAINKPPIPDTISIDIALLIDTTGSMAPYCKPTLSTIQCLVSGNSSILTKLKSQFSETEIKLRLGVLGYRDLDDQSSQFYESTWNGGAHFTDSVADAIASVSNTVGSPSGGHDLAEDHFGAITRSLAWNGANDWSSPIKVILLFTDAPAHGFVPSSSSQMPNADGYSVCHPNGLTSASVADNLVSKGVNLITCSYHPFATGPFEKQLANDYSNHPSNSEGREIRSISMIAQPGNSGQTLIGDHPRHIVFILDESGSMRDDWGGVVGAFQKYIARRRQNQNESDLVSVVQFDDSARVTVRQESIGSASRNLGYRGGFTQFAPAAIEGSQLAATTPASHRPTIVFMSDGGTNDAFAAASTFSALNQQVRQKHGCDLDLHVIAFGCGADTQQLQQISRASPKGRVYLSSDTVQLTNIFSSIAGGQQIAAVLQEEIGKEISEAVSDTLNIGYLS